MKVLIIEDEPLAAERLTQLIHEYESHIQVLAIIDTIEDAVAWFGNNKAPDLIFQDIELADGSSFRIFEQVRVQPPIIFTTAYDSYALQAFKMNSVDYLLKPFDYEELAAALDKFVQVFWKKKQSGQQLDLEALAQALRPQKQTFKERFVVKRGEFIHPVPVSEILYFYSEDKATLFRTRDNERFVIDGTLNEVETRVDPRLFFRVNRQFLCRLDGIEEILAYSQRRLRLSLRFMKEEEVLVSREKIRSFREWLDG